MARGKRWTEEENKLLREMVESKLSVQQIFDSGKLPGRSYEAIRMQKKKLPIDSAKTKSIVESIVPGEAIELSEVLERYSDAFKQICKEGELDKLQLERFRIIFSAAKDYAPLLAHYERLSQVEKEMAELRQMVKAIKAQLAKRG